MFYALSWIVVLGLLGLWTFGAWALHALAGWAAANAGLAGGWAAALDSLQLPAWLAVWTPLEDLNAVKAMLGALAPFIDGLLSLAPSLAVGLSVVVWGTWGVGALLLLGLGVLLHVVVARSSPRPALQPA